MADHKQEIIETRSLGFGSSDAKMIASVGKIGQLNETARKRIAEMLGLKERDEVSTMAMEKGNEIEEAIFQSIKSAQPSAVSNPLCKSETLSDTFGFGVFNHIDIELENENTIAWWECKATIKSMEQTEDDYKYQIAWHWMLLQEKSNGRKAMLFLTHYDTSDGSAIFDSKNVSQKKTNFEDYQAYIDEIIDGLGVIADELPSFAYEPQISSDGLNLPAETQALLPKINNLLRMAKDAEEQAEKFKAELKKAMEDAGIKSIDNDYFKATYVPEGVAAKFDSKSLQKDNPELYKKYLKNSTVKSQLRLTLK